jgi:membrane protease YdiL (CAAX protease family)
MGNARRELALLEPVLLAGVAWALHGLLRAMGAPLALGAMATLVLLVPCTWLLHRRGVSWGELGFKRITRYGRTIAWAIGLFLVLMLLPALVTAPLAFLLALPPRHLEVFADLRGNLPLFLVTLVTVGWGAAAFGEELVFRGFIFRRLIDAFGGTRLGVTGALALQAGLFALGHLYLGPRGVLDAACVGLVSGAAYLANGRDLWPLIIAHGLVDTVGITALYLGATHG